MTPERVCENCGLELRWHGASNDGEAAVCANCRQLFPKRTLEDDAAERLTGLAGPNFEGFGRGSQIMLGLVMIPVALGFGGVALVGMLSPDIAPLPPKFFIGMWVFASVSALISVASLFPSSRAWSLPLILGVLSLIFLAIKVLPLFR